jgi:FkbM family methyltransferase
MQKIRSALKFPLRLLLAYLPFRKRAVFELVRTYYADLNVVVPLFHGIKCPIVSQEHWVSYENVFAEKEYDDLLKIIPLPGTWLDLGCHAGHFSLLLASHWAEKGDRANWRGLLVDPDSRVQASIRQITACNGFTPQQMVFLPGAISATGEDLVFSENLYMTSEIASRESKGVRRVVRCVRQEDILNRMEPPYDLIKLDIEGAEYDFFLSYDLILSKTKYLLFEWHSWHRGGGGKAQLVGLAEQSGFRFLAESHCDRVIHRYGKAEQCGTILMENVRFKGDTR